MSERATAEDEGRHARLVERVVTQLRAHRDGRVVSFRKKAVSHQVPKRDDRTYTDEKIDISELDQILEIDTEAWTCTAESGVTFSDLVLATLRHGLAPIIVPELKTITIGGAVTGCSLESRSFEYGGFHDTCLEYEVITADGDVLRCTPDNEHRLVFQMMHGSFGTLGVLSKLKFRLLPASPYVHVRYDRFRTLAEYQAAIHRHFVERDVDFMDGIIHAPDDHVLSLGKFVEEAPYTTRYDWTKVYYLSTRERPEDFLATRDYFFRYDHGVTNVHPKSAIGRLVLGRLMDSGRLLRAAEKLHRLLPAERPTVTVDLFIPSSRLDEFLRWYRDAIGFFPLWCVPYRVVRDYEWLQPSFFAKLEDRLFIDLAIYGLEQPEGRNYYAEIEEELPRVNGLKTLISHNFYDEETFWKTWNRSNYVAVKRVTDPRNLLRDFYDKTCRAPRGLDDLHGPLESK